MLAHPCSGSRRFLVGLDTSLLNVAAQLVLLEKLLQPVRKPLLSGQKAFLVQGNFLTLRLCRSVLVNRSVIFRSLANLRPFAVPRRWSAHRAEILGPPEAAQSAGMLDGEFRITHDQALVAGSN